MISSNNIMSTLLKATGLSAILFWIIIIPNGYNVNELPIILVSFIPIAIVSSITIVITILPFFLIEKKGVNPSVIYKKYFPYYSIIVFSISIYLIIKSDFEIFVIAFFTAAFFTLIQSWVWICKPGKKENEKENF